MDSAAKLLGDLLPAMAAPTTVRFRAAASPAAACDPPVSRDTGPWTRRRWLFLYSTADGTAPVDVVDGSKQEGANMAGQSRDEILVAGMVVAEYSSPDTCILHVEKVDSTGIRPPSSRPSMTRACVAASLKLLLALSRKKHTSIHCFARPQPEYIFPLSSKRNSKQVLQPAQLTRWWLLTLDLAVRDCVGASKTAYVPGEDGASASKALRTAAELGWTIGYPYDPFANAADVIHAFADDPKGRLLKELGKHTTVQELWEVGGLAQDAGGGGFLWVLLDEPASAANDTESRNSLTDEEWSTLTTALAVSDWSSQQLSVTSSSNVLATWPRGSVVVDVAVAGNGDANAGEMPVARAAEAATLNSALVKRKPRADSHAANAKKPKT
ncbi:histone acetylation protein-domain-containing protein [Hyaloraphidium curvatum]|nr:histone acetylation protein-domain-containing protein [Hyaloraphidium curvatum]